MFLRYLYLPVNSERSSLTNNNLVLLNIKVKKNMQVRGNNQLILFDGVA